MYNIDEFLFSIDKLFILHSLCYLDFCVHKSIINKNIINKSIIDKSIIEPVFYTGQMMAS